MIKIIKANKRHFSDFGWLKTYWLFSFADYYDPDNIQFGALRVFNDDVVEPGTGFPTHPHHEMEIITIVLDGEITHTDSMGNKAVIKAGEVQRMSAGTGLTHSEFNLSNKPVHFYQIWLYPDIRGSKPSYAQRNFAAMKGENKLLPVASGQKIADTVSFQTDATIYLGQLERGGRLEYKVGENRQIYIYVTSGEISINAQNLGSSDQARVDLEDALALAADGASKFVLIDVPSCKGWGYDRKTLRGERS